MAYRAEIIVASKMKNKLHSRRHAAQQTSAIFNTLSERSDVYINAHHLIAYQTLATAPSAFNLPSYILHRQPIS